MLNKRGQIALFIIIAIAIVAGVGLYIYLNSSSSASSIPKELAPAFDYYQSCISQETSRALDIAGSQAGYISLPPYSPPSVYSPFSSRLNYMGLEVPYWSYISGNGLIKEQTPSKADIEKQIADYLSSNVPSSCDFSDFTSRGWQVSLGAPSFQVSIQDSQVVVQESAALKVSYLGQSADKNSYSVQVPTKFGTMLNTAQALYSAEAESAFLENYSWDVINLYAPVDGVEIGCAPKVWKSADVETSIKQGLEANIQALNYGKTSSYFNVPIQTNGEDVQSTYFSSWPSRLEIAGADGALMKTDAIGPQQGLGALGFCYQPYHFVYSLMYPVMFQIMDSGEIFQFPVVVQIKDNSIRGGYNVTGLNESSQQDICAASTQPLSVSLQDVNLNPVEGNVSYTCFDQSCQIGSTSRGKISGMVPACLNGFIDVQAQGYSSAEIMFSSNNASSATITLDKLYDTNISLLVDGKPLNGASALVYFTGAQSGTVEIPDVSSTKLSEGFYNVSVYVYGNSSITIPATTSRQCTNVPASGILGFLGQTKEQCYDINVPATNVGSALIGGGQGEIYLVPEMLSGGNLTLSVQGLPTPKSIDDLQTNYALFDTQGVDVIR